MLDIEDRLRKKKGYPVELKTSRKTRVNFTIDTELMLKFREYCKEHSINMSGKVEKLIKHFIDSTEIRM